jgi:hypothetical protein
MWVDLEEDITELFSDVRFEFGGLEEHIRIVALEKPENARLRMREFRKTKALSEGRTLAIRGPLTDEERKVRRREAQKKYRQSDKGKLVESVRTYLSGAEKRKRKKAA